MDPLSVIASSVAISGTVTAAASHIKNFRSNYRNAESQQRHIQRQKDRIQKNRELLSRDQVLIHNQLPYLESAFFDAEAALSSQPHQNRKRDRVRWAVSGKNKTDIELAKLKDVEGSAGFTLLLAMNDKLGEIVTQFNNQEQRHNSCENRLRSLEEANYDMEGLGVVSKTSNQRQHLAAQIYCWKWLLCLGIMMRLVTSQDGRRTAYRVIIRWPLLFNIVLTWHLYIIQSWLQLPRLSLQFLRARALIPEDAAIIRACKENNLDIVRDLFATAQAHVTDVTLGNFTLLRFAIRAGNHDIAKFLLENGADPNQTFGARETSPLNNAFLKGRRDIIELLLSHKADLEYLNTRTWTSVYYLWDPIFPNHAETSEILDVCAAYGFCSWNESDLAGWAPIHRAAAFGKEEHIRILFNRQLVDPNHMPVTRANWCPLQCAARYGNWSTFSYLSKHCSEYDLNRLDTRGWNLLHLAAAGGCKRIMSQLLSWAFDPRALSDVVTFSLPEVLKRKALTPRTVAEYYGHATVYEETLHQFGISDRMVQE